LEHLVRNGPDDKAFGYLEKWLQLAPFDRHVHELLLATLARHGRIREGEEHLAATIRQFEAEGLDGVSIRDAWRTARAQADRLPRALAAAPAAAPAPGGGRGGIVGAQPRRASIAVMPFVDRSTVTGVPGGAADALAHDIITRLAKLRSLLVIAQGTVFALHER